jgi:hypothetical protein
MCVFIPKRWLMVESVNPHARPGIRERPKQHVDLVLVRLQLFGGDALPYVLPYLRQSRADPLVRAKIFLVSVPLGRTVFGFVGLVTYGSLVLVKDDEQIFENDLAL